MSSAKAKECSTVSFGTGFDPRSPAHRLATLYRNGTAIVDTQGATVGQPEKAEEAHLADTYAGRQLRALRAIHGVTQQELSNAIGKTFQQIQKYERGTNRMAVSTVCEIAKVLKVNPVIFLPTESLELEIAPLPHDIRNKEIASLIKWYCKIASSGDRQKVRDIVKMFGH